MVDASRPVIEAYHLGKTYRIYGNPYHRLLERMPWQRRPLHREVRALHDVTFVLQRGECMGLVGNNGAGKSTLLKILSGTTFPTEGRYSVNGRATSLLELSAGFHHAFSGRENILMNAALM
jgi:ABC-type polysaccharide/polyol phosphate transport system ATPase subunit